MGRVTIVIFFLVVIYTGIKAQEGIDFFPKMLLNELNRLNGRNNVLEELPSSPVISGQILAGRFYSVLNNSSTSPINYLYIGRVYTCMAGGCSINTNQSNINGSEFFDYFILFDSTCTVQLVKIYNYQATRGHEITSKNWLKQFNGYNGSIELHAGKNIDAISGATRSVNAATLEMVHKTGLLRQIVNKSSFGDD